MRCWLRRAALAAIPVVIVALTSAADAQERVFRPATTYHVPVGESASRGPADALVTIVEFSDFRCGACRLAHTRMQELLSLYPGQVRLVYKHFVIFGERSLLATFAAMAAGEQGQFWAMHDRIFTGETREIDYDLLAGYARDIGLDMVRYRAAIEAESPPFKDALLADMRLAGALGIDATPIFFINGKPIPGVVELGGFIRVVDEEIKRAQYALQAGTKQDEVYDTLIADGEREGDIVVRRDLDPTATYKVPLGDNGHARGPADALVTLVLFEDFQCGFCARQSATVKKLIEEYGDDLRVVFRHMPLDFHKDAQLAHEAAMEASAQGQFWEMHDLLYQDTRSLGREDLEGYAKKLGLKMKRFRSALDSGKHREAVLADKQEGAALAVSGTPTAFINGTPIVGAQPIQSFRAMIDAKKAEAEELVRQGTAAKDVYRTVVGLD